MEENTNEIKTSRNNINFNNKIFGSEQSRGIFSKIGNKKNICLKEQNNIAKPMEMKSVHIAEKTNIRKKSLFNFLKKRK
ncbi:MAG: hypothetical protein JJE21_09465 [Spirochaetaceae bacterium]|nr:hypothetical protein [Spirochaetaceae bacterium]